MSIKKILIIAICILIISNLPPVKGLFSIFFDEDNYRYSNADGTYTNMDVKGSHYNLMPMVPGSFQSEHPGTSDTIVYRLFWKNPLAFWRWSDYFTDKRYSLPYKSWKSIRKKRGYDIKYSNRWQDF